MTRIAQLLIILGSITILTIAASARTDTTFTYQGSLTESRATANGSFDFEFSLWDDAAAGGQIGSTEIKSGVPVTDGLFSVTLDFGPGAFGDGDRWLAITVAGTPLLPRQPVTPAPLSMFAEKAAGAFGTFSILESPTGIPPSILVGAGGPSIVSDLAANGIIITGGTPDPTSLTLGQGGPSIMSDLAAQGIIITGGLGDPGSIQFGTGGPTIGPDGSADGGIIICTPQGLMLEHPTAGQPVQMIFGQSPTGGSGPTLGTDATSPGIILSNISELHIVGGYAGFGIPPSIRPEFQIDLPNIADPDGQARANAWTTHSSRRWKENIRPVDDALDKIEHLEGVAFDWKEEQGGSADIGFIAEDVGKVLPELVTWEDDGVNARSLKYDRITAVTVEAIKAQQSQIERMQTHIATLEEQMATLQAQVLELYAAQSESSSGAER